MKRRALIRLPERNGWCFKRSGGNHDIYTNGADNEPISQQKEIKEAANQTSLNVSAVLQAALKRELRITEG